MRTLGIGVLVFYFSLCSSQTPVTVNTNAGSIIGHQENINIDGEQKLISKFLGIPYGESTAGQNRFQKPVPKAYFQRTFDARNTPMACFQQSKAEVDLYKDIFKVPGFSEDCLTLNIYVPNGLKSSALLPVMVWIYGGAFTQGAASLYRPDILSIFGNVIVVTINYRIGMFGFLRDSHGNFPGNQGLWDQHLAIKWVHENIDSFLGYKDEITIFGESAGGASVLFQAMYPGNKGLFKRVIAESGTAVAQWAIKDVSSFEKYLTEMGCPPNSNNIVACMQMKDPMSLLSNSTTFGPVVDGDFLVRTPHAMLNDPVAKTAEARDFFASLDIIVGVNDMEGAVYFGVWLSLLGHKDLEYNISRNEFREHIVPYIVNSTLTAKDDNVTREALKSLLTFYYTNWEDPYDYVSIRNNAIDIANDATFFAPAIQTAGLHAMLQRGNTFFYEFAVQNGNHFTDVPSWVKGSNHGDEIAFLLGAPLGRQAKVIAEFTSNYTSEEQQVSRAMMALWSNFAKSGNPNIPMNVTQFIHTTWPEYSMTSQRYLQISNTMSPASVKARFYPRRMEMWSNLIPHITSHRDTNLASPDIFHVDPILIG